MEIEPNKQEDHICECGYEHAQNNDHDHSEDHNQGGITVSHHEGATICSVERIIVKEYVWVKDNLARELEILADWVEEQGGIVGHIKVFLTENGYSSMLSTTGGPVQIKETRKPKTAINLAIIAFVENDTALYSKLVELLAKLR